MELTVKLIDGNGKVARERLPEHKRSEIPVVGIRSCLNNSGAKFLLLDFD